MNGNFIITDARITSSSSLSRKNLIESDQQKKKKKMIGQTFFRRYFIKIGKIHWIMILFSRKKMTNESKIMIIM